MFWFASHSICTSLAYHAIVLRVNESGTRAGFLLVVTPNSAAHQPSLTTSKR